MSDSTGGQPAEGAVQAQPLSPFMQREPGGGGVYRVTATNFLCQEVRVEVRAHLTPAALRAGAPCAIFISAHVQGLSVDMPRMMAAEARRLADALLKAADDAERIDGGVVQ